MCEGFYDYRGNHGVAVKCRGPFHGIVRLSNHRKNMAVLVGPRLLMPVERAPSVELEEKWKSPASCKDGPTRDESKGDRDSKIRPKKLWSDPEPANSSSERAG